MVSRGGVKLAANEEREGRELLLVEVVESWEEMRGIARAEAVCDFGERVADFQKNILYLCVVYGRKGVEDSVNFPDAVLNDVTREGDVADGSAEQQVGRRLRQRRSTKPAISAGLVGDQLPCRGLAVDRTPVANLGDWPTRVTSSRKATVRRRLETSDWMRRRIGWRTRAKKSDARGSPC